MLKQILREWSPGWKPFRWRATLIGIFAMAIIIPLAFLALPYLEILNDMAVQPKAKAQGEYGWFSDVQIPSERLPVPGTFPMSLHEYYPYPFPKGTGKEEEAAAKPAAAHWKSPYVTRSVKAVQIERGEKIFHNICRTCHGPRGDADGPIVGAGLFPAPPSLHTKQAREFTDGRIFHVITVGQQKMPSYATTLAPDERWAVILYVRALQRAKIDAEEGN
jgi:mono/diheme cytochrome c family protein